MPFRPGEIRSTPEVVFGIRGHGPSYSERAILEGDRIQVDHRTYFVAWVDPKDGTERPRNGPITFRADNRTHPFVLRIDGSTWAIQNGTEEDFERTRFDAVVREARRMLNVRFDGKHSEIIDLIAAKCEAMFYTYDDTSRPECVIC